MRSVETMPKLFRRTNDVAVYFCERCSSVWTAADRREALLARSREQALLLYGWRAA
jgi:Zn-finger nucleic acid-binding protein